MRLQTPIAAEASNSSCILTSRPTNFKTSSKCTPSQTADTPSYGGELAAAVEAAGACGAFVMLGDVKKPLNALATQPPSWARLGRAARLALTPTTAAVERVDLLATLAANPSKLVPLIPVVLATFAAILLEKMLLVQHSAAAPPGWSLAESLADVLAIAALLRVLDVLLISRDDVSRFP